MKQKPNLKHAEDEVQEIERWVSRATNPQKELLDTRMNMILDNAKMGIMPPYNPSTPSPMPTIDKYIEEFMDGLCPCRWIITTPEHSKKDCPHYTFAPERDFIRDALQTYGEERELAEYERMSIEKTVECDEAFERGKSDGEAQGIRRAHKIVMDSYHGVSSPEVRAGIAKAAKALKALLPPNE